MAACHFKGCWRIGKSGLPPQPERESYGSLKKHSGSRLHYMKSSDPLYISLKVLFFKQLLGFSFGWPAWANIFSILR